MCVNYPKSRDLVKAIIRCGSTMPREDSAANLSMEDVLETKINSRLERSATTCASNRMLGVSVPLFLAHRTLMNGKDTLRKDGLRLFFCRERCGRRPNARHIVNWFLFWKQIPANCLSKRASVTELTAGGPTVKRTNLACHLRMEVAKETGITSLPRKLANTSVSSLERAEVSLNQAQANLD